MDEIEEFKRDFLKKLKDLEEAAMGGSSLGESAILSIRYAFITNFLTLVTI